MKLAAADAEYTLVCDGERIRRIELTEGTTPRFGAESVLRWGVWAVH